MRIISLNHPRSDIGIDKDQGDPGWSSAHLEHLLKTPSFLPFLGCCSKSCENCTKYLIYLGHITIIIVTTEHRSTDHLEDVTASAGRNKNAVNEFALGPKIISVCHTSCWLLLRTSS